MKPVTRYRFLACVWAILCEMAETDLGCLAAFLMTFYYVYLWESL